MTYYLALRKYNMSLTLKDRLGNGISFLKCGDYRSVKRGNWDKSLPAQELNYKTNTSHEKGVPQYLDEKGWWTDLKSLDCGWHEWTRVALSLGELLGHSSLNRGTHHQNTELQISNYVLSLIPNGGQTSKDLSVLEQTLQTRSGCKCLHHTLITHTQVVIASNE